MSTLKVMRFNDSQATPALLPGTAPIPQPGPGEVLIRVRAAGVTPTELIWYPTIHTHDGGKRIGAIPGHEFSGIVEAFGNGVEQCEAGSEVFGMNDWFAEGATAEYCLAKPTSLARKPRRLSHAEAATAPIGALTAWQGLLARAGLKAGERVLIHGGAGAVGVFAIQLARRAGARVFTTASAKHAEFLRELGADEVIDYHTARFEEHALDMDVVFDAVGGQTLQRSWQVLKSGGRMVTIAAEGENARDDRTKAAFFIVEPNQAQLNKVANLFDRNELRTFVDGVVPLSEASAAYTGAARRSNGRGKLVIEIA
jgi:NADPH:quinone reductase-like Zn-dependent oxidoreductase